MDTLYQNNLTIDLEKLMLRRGVEAVPLLKRCSQENPTVAVNQEEVTILPWEFQEVTLLIPENECYHGTVLLEAETPNGIYIKDTQINAVQNKVILDLYNGSDTDINIQKGKRLAKIYPIIDINSCDKKGTKDDNEEFDFFNKGRIDELVMMVDYCETSFADWQKCEIKDLIAEFADVFELPTEIDVVRTPPPISVKINLLHDYPLAARARKLPIQWLPQIQEEIQRMIKSGVIEPSSSAYNSPLVVVR